MLSASAPAATPGEADFPQRSAQLFRALSEPLRLRILNLLLNRSELCVCDLVTALDAPQSLVSRHLAYLRRAGLVLARREGVWMHYRLDDSKPLARELLSVWHARLEGALNPDLQRLESSRNCC